MYKLAVNQNQGGFFRAIEGHFFGTRVLFTAKVCTVRYLVVGAVNKKQDPLFTLQCFTLQYKQEQY